MVKNLKTYIIAVFVFTCIGAYAAPSEAICSDQEKEYKFLRDLSTSAKKLSYIAEVKRNLYAGTQEFTLTKRISKQGKMRTKEEILFATDSDRIGNYDIIMNSMRYSYGSHGDSISVRDISGPYRSSAFQTESRYLLLKNYSLKFLREEKILGDVATIVKIIPNQRDRNQIKLWVSKKNHYVYKFQRFDKDGKLIYEEFTKKIDFDPKFVEDEFVVNGPLRKRGNANQKYYKNMYELMENYTNAIYISDYTPVGFVLDKIRVYTPSRTKTPIVHFYYTDGLAAISLFQRVTVDGDNERLGLREFYRNNSKMVRIADVKDDIYLYLTTLDMDKEALSGFFDTLHITNKKDDPESKKKGAGEVIKK